MKKSPWNPRNLKRGTDSDLVIRVAALLRNLSSDIKAPSVPHLVVGHLRNDRHETVTMVSTTGLDVGWVELSFSNYYILLILYPY